MKFWKKERGRLSDVFVCSWFQNENLGQIPSEMIEKQTFPGWRPAAEEEI